MICPECQTKYPEGHTSCPDCQVALRSNLSVAEEMVARAAPGDTLTPLWDGGDLAFHAALVDELELAGIPFFDSSSATLPTQEGLSSVFGAVRPGLVYQVAVLASQIEAAERLVEKVESMDLPDLSLPTDQDQIPLQPEPTVPLPEQPRVEVWSGEDSDRCQFLIDALHENSISLWLEPTAAGNAIHVAQPDELAAREIVREVTDASPPE